MAHTLYVGTEKPAAKDCIFVDTSVLLLVTYPKMLSGPGYLSERTQLYSDFLEQCRRVGATLYWCGLSLSEMGHKIEELHCAASKYGGDLKSFRRDPEHRPAVLSDIETAWSQVQTFGTSLDGAIDKESTVHALEIMQRAPVDGYDAFYLKFMRDASIDKVLTDDSDFSGVPNIIVFSAHRKLCD